jgi:hypothetical protein
VLDGHDKLHSDVLHQLRTRWEPTYGGWSPDRQDVLDHRGVLRMAQGSEPEQRAHRGQPVATQTGDGRRVQR